MADVYVNALTTISTEPSSTDSIVVVNRNTNEGQIIDYELLASKVLEKLTSKTFSALHTTSKVVTGAINEHESDLSSLSNNFNGMKQNIAIPGNTTTTLTFDNTLGGRRLMVVGHQSETSINGMYLLINNAVIVIVNASALTVTTDGSSVTVTSTAASNRTANGFII